jgi:hypothetical protein
MMQRFRFCANIHGGQSTLEYIVFAEPGGINTISLRVSPR